MAKKVKKQAEAKSIFWLRASYHFHTYCYRDPRAVYASSVGIPVVSPTTILLGIASILFRLGMSESAKKFLDNCKYFSIRIDAPQGVIFFRAFHQVRRYESNKWGENPRIGFTNINQATKEYGLVDGQMTIFLGITEEFIEYVKLALTNLTHLGTHDSLCSLVSEVEQLESEPNDIIYSPSSEAGNKLMEYVTKAGKPITMITLSQFKRNKVLNSIVGDYWWMSGGDNTEQVTYIIPGKFEGTTRGKIYKRI